MHDRAGAGAIENLAGPRFKVTCWGEFSVADMLTGTAIKLRGRKARALLAYVVMHPGKRIGRERLASLLWGDRPDEQARASLRQALVELKVFASGDTPLLAIERDQMSLNSTALATDVADLVALVDRGLSAEFLSALPEANERFLADLDRVDADFDDWLVIERTHQADALAGLIARAARDSLAQGDTATMRSLQMRLKHFDPAFQHVDPLPPTSSHSNQARTPDALQPAVAKLLPRDYGRWRLPIVSVAIAMVVTILIWWLAVPSEREPRTIAVLPFTDLSANKQPYLADGIVEEIMARLARDPAQKLIGRTSVWSFRDERIDAVALGRRLNASYLVEGSVRSVGNQVRVDVSLVKTEDGARLWTEQFVGPIGDLFGIQDRIGDAVSRRFRSRNGDADGQAPRGAAYALYLTAKGLIRTREDAKLAAATEILRQVVKIDPEYAEAWAALGRVLIVGGRYLPDSLSEGANSTEALDSIRRAIALQPGLAEAHLALGMALGPGDSRKAEFMRAVQLDPANEEAWSALALEYRFRGDYERELYAWRRAVSIDPLWPRAFFSASDSAWDLGLHEEALRYAQRAAADAPPKPFETFMVHSDTAMRRGDYSESLASADLAIRTAPRGREFFGELARARALRAMGDFDRARGQWPFYKMDDAMWGMWHNKPPTTDQVQALLSSPKLAWDNEAAVSFRLATLINANRAKEASALFDAKFRSPEDMATSPPFGHAAFVRHAALIALALRMSGRAAESQRMIAIADAQVQTTTMRGRPVPSWYPALAAQLWAVAGRREAALSSLERASSRGWYYGAERDAFIDIGLEPAFSTLRNEARFQRVRNRFLIHARRERAEAKI